MAAQPSFLVLDDRQFLRAAAERRVIGGADGPSAVPVGAVEVAGEGAPTEAPFRVTESESFAGLAGEYGMGDLVAESGGLGRRC